MGSLAGQHLRALTEIAEARAIDLSPTATERDDIARSEVAPVLEQAVDAAAALATAASLYATGRLPFEGDVCDLADRHAAEWVAEWVAEFHTAHDLVSVAVIEELVSQGETCRCVCPACGIGACLCMRNSIDTVRSHWGRRGLEPSEGIELRISPRPGSQLADAGLQRGDRTLAVDGDTVHDNRELQQALRRRPIGKAATVTVLRGGVRDDLAVARVSDLP